MALTWAFTTPRTNHNRQGAKIAKKKQLLNINKNLGDLGALAVH